jgi:hypothetical protein
MWDMLIKFDLCQPIHGWQDQTKHWLLQIGGDSASSVYTTKHQKHGVTVGRVHTTQ